MARRHSLAVKETAVLFFTHRRAFSYTLDSMRGFTSPASSRRGSYAARKSRSIFKSRGAWLYYRSDSQTSNFPPMPRPSEGIRRLRIEFISERDGVAPAVVASLSQREKQRLIGRYVSLSLSLSLPRDRQGGIALNNNAQSFCKTPARRAPHFRVCRSTVCPSVAYPWALFHGFIETA